MIKPTNHQVITGAQANELPDGSIVLFPDHAYSRGPLMRDGEQWQGSHLMWRIAPDSTLWLLHLPDPTPPKIGDELTLQQLEALPHKAGIVDRDGDLWQRTRPGTWRRPDFEKSVPSVDVHGAYGPLTLVWLPPDEPAVQS